MKKTVLTFGLISGAIFSVIMFGTLPFLPQIGFDIGMVIGFTSMFLAFLLVFFGIRSYRENIGDGEISFLRAFSVGILITLIATLCYVVTWQVIYFNFMPDFFEKYTVYMLEHMRTSGASAQEIEATRQAMVIMGRRYNNHLWNAAYTFLEPFPIGFVITLLSAIILRKKPKVVNGEQQLAST